LIKSIYSQAENEYNSCRKVRREAVKEETMEYEVVYEISKHPFPIDTVGMGVMAVFALFICAATLVGCWKDRNIDFFDIFKIVGALFLGITCTWGLISSFSYGGSDEAGYAKKYYAGEYSVIECVVEEYGYSNTGIACFDAEGKSFYMHYTFRNPIPLDKEIRVSYVPDDNGEYYIVKVEVKKE